MNKAWSYRVGAKRWGAVGLALTAALLVGCFGKTAVQYLDAAKAALEKKDGAAAIIQLKNALQEDPGSAEARYLLGKTLMSRGDYRGGGIELQKARDLGYDSELVMPEQARFFLATGEPEKVITEFEGKSLKSAERQAELQTMLAMAYRAVNKLDQAQAAVEAALAANPKNIEAQLFQIRLRIATSGTSGVTEVLDKLSADAPTNADVWQLKGDVLQVEGKPDEALAAYRESIKRDNTHVAAHGAAVWLLLMRKDLAGAEAQLDQLRAVFPTLAQTRLLTAMLALDKGDVKTATELAQQLVKEAPNSVPALQLEGALAMRQGLMTQAERSLSKALSIAPDNMRVRLLLAQAQLRRGDAPKVLKSLQPLMEAPNAPWEATVLMAQALLVSGDVERASSYFSKAVSLQPADIHSRTALALARIDKGRVDDGVGELESISASDSGITADLALVNFHMKRKNFQAARASIARLESKQPNQPVAPYLNGQTLLMLGERDEARSAFQAALKKEAGYFPASAALAAMDVADGKPELAKERFAALSEKDPSDIRPAMALVEVMTKMRATPADLAQMLTKIIRTNPAAVAPRVRLIALQLENKNVKGALAGAQEAVTQNPDNVDLLDVAAQAYFMNGDTNQAIVHYNQIASLRPNSPEPFVSMARIRLLQNDRAAAAQELKRALSVRPDHLPAHRALIDMELAAGRHGAALSMARALRQQPGNAAQAGLMEGDIYASRKEWADAAKAYQFALERQAAPEPAIKLHRALLASGQLAAAQRMESEWLRSHADEPSFQYYLGDLAMAKNDYVGARQRYADVVRVAPDNPLALNNLAWLLNRDKDPQALKYALEATRLAPQTSSFLDTLAGIYADSAQVQKAVETQLEAVRIAPDVPELRLHLAKYYILADEKGKAKAELLRLAGLGSKFKGQADVQSMLATL